MVDCDRLLRLLWPDIRVGEEGYDHTAGRAFVRLPDVADIRVAEYLPDQLVGEESADRWASIEAEIEAEIDHDG